MIKTILYDVGGVLHSMHGVSADQPIEESVEPHPHMLQLAADLRRRGLRTAIMSDTIQEHATVLERMGIYDGFEPKFLSYQTGLRKPSPEAFRHVLQALQCQPEEVLFIDDLAINVDAAELLGVQGIVYDGQADIRQQVERIIARSSSDNPASAA